MAEVSTIEWTDATWNPVTGCSVISPGCKHCYAMKLAGTRLRHHRSRAGLTVDSAAGPVWTGEVRVNDEWMLQPLHWRRPRRIFVCAHGDLFHEDVADATIDLVFAVMARCPQHIFQVLTKRAERMRDYIREMYRLPDDLAHFYDLPVGTLLYDTPPNVWLGVSVENRKLMLERGKALSETPASVRYWSAEPLLEDLGEIPAALMPHWLIVGGESGRNARPMHPDWARSLRDQCAAVGVPFFFKQWGAWSADFDDNDFRQVRQGVLNGDDRQLMAHVGKKAAGRLLDGVQHDGMPA